MEPRDYSIEPGPMGAIGEYEALMLRVNRNCPWNRCLFCPVYKGSRFGTRSAEELKRDIDAVRRTRDLLHSTSSELGLGGRLRADVLREVVARNPTIYGGLAYGGAASAGATADGAGYDGAAPDGGAEVSAALEQRLAVNCLGRVANWLACGAERVFLQDADALAMKVEDLAAVLRYLKEAFPSIRTITCYARTKSASRRSVQELAELKNAGLTWCFAGIESGSDAVLDYVKKGVTKKEHIEGGRKLQDAGIQMAAFVMPGLSGHQPGSGPQHIDETLDVLNGIAPAEVRVRSLTILEYALLYEKYRSGEFSAPTEDQLVEEIIQLLEGIGFDCTIETLQMTNPVVNIKGPISDMRPQALQRLKWFQRLSPTERAVFGLRRYVEGGYLGCVEALGMKDAKLEALLDEAESSIVQNSPEAAVKTERAIFGMKSKIVP